MTKINWYNGKTANSASDMQKLCNAINHSLSTPVSAPADTKIVAVDNTNSQKMLTIGDGLSIENDTLKASVSGGNKLYKHYLVIQGYSYIYAYMTLINTSNEIITNNTLFDILQLSVNISATGYLTNNTCVMSNIKKFETGLVFKYIKFSITDNKLTKTIPEEAVSISNVTVVDNVEELI